MLKLRVIVVIFFALTGFTTSSYTCSCYCWSSYSSVGTAYSDTCSNSACTTACNNGLSSCSYSYYTSGSVWNDESCFYTLISFSRSCTGSYSGSYSGDIWDSTSYDTAFSVGTIIGIVVGSLTGLGVLISIIVITCILCKRKRAQVWSIQAQNQPVMPPSFISGPGQQWTPGINQYPPAGSTNNFNLQYPSTYSSAQPVQVQV